MIRLASRHSRDFDVHSESIDPRLSDYNEAIPDYGTKVLNFYSQLGVSNVLWAFDESERPSTMEVHKPIEYVFEVPLDRIIAYVDSTWDQYIAGKRSDFQYSTTETKFPNVSFLVQAPITRSELKIIREYRIRRHPGDYELVYEEFVN